MKALDLIYVVQVARLLFFRLAYAWWRWFLQINTWHHTSMPCTFIRSFLFYQQKSCLPNDCYYREKELLLKSLEKWGSPILLRPDHFGISSEALIVFGPSFSWLCRWKIQTVKIIKYCFFSRNYILVPFLGHFGNVLLQAMVIFAWSDISVLDIFRKDSLYNLSSIFITAAFLRFLQSM